MSKDYVADNAGTGFASFDDDGPSDLDSLLAGAALGEEEDDQETASFFTDSEPEPVKTVAPPVAAPTRTRQTKATVKPVKEELVINDDDEEYDDLPVAEPVAYTEFSRGQRSWETDPNPTFSAPPIISTPAPVQAPVPEPEPAPTRVKHSFSDAPAAARPPVAARRTYATNEADEVEMAGKIIRILDAYRKLSSDVQTIASQFITNGSEVIEDEATLVVKVINVDQVLAVTMKALREAKALDPVERVFFVISLEDDVLHSLGGLVAVFTSGALDGSLDKIAYARNLVREIEKLDARAVNYIESTESILSAANGESN